ncbi:zinc dependent phospholipase C family protein [Clostridiaceae bacterium 35-E11]
MLVNTHRLIGQKVHENVQKLLNIRLNKNNFIYGNMKPDLVYRLSSKSHCMKDSLYFVIDEMNRLLSTDKMNIEQFSIDLGVINHFLSDFFSSPHYHQGEKFNGIIRHMNYEYKLHKIFKKLERYNLLNLSILKIESFTKSTILETILYLEDTYKKQNVNIENDIYYALRVSTLASIYILEKSSVLHDNKMTA